MLSESVSLRIQKNMDIIKFCILLHCFSSVFSDTLEDQSYWRQLGKYELAKALQKENIDDVAKNVILFVGDGMGPTTVTSARIYRKGETGHLAWEHFDNIGVLKIYSANKLVPDSCSTATALFSGIKANHKTSGVDHTVNVNDCDASLKKSAQLESFIDWAQEAGKSTGFVTTTRVTHATPSALYAHTPNRRWECEANVPLESSNCKDIGYQLVNESPGKNIEVIMGGGRQCLVANVTGTPADPLDTWSCISKQKGRDLITDWKTDKSLRQVTYQVLENNENLENMDESMEYTLGIFANGHLKLDYERDSGPEGMPSLSDMTAAAIKLLRKNPNGYALMVEGGNIDQAHHRGHARKALDETAALSDAVEVALNMTDELETLIIVTSDHSHSMLLTGYPDRTQGVLSYSTSEMDERPYTNLVYGTGGPNNYQFYVENDTVQRVDPTTENMTDFEYSQQAVVYNDEVTHSGTDVLVYATGPMAHLFNSVHEQSYVAYVISYALQIGVFEGYEADPEESAAMYYHCSWVPIVGVFLLFIYQLMC
ncbi:alkaline phosphatase, tissue-nonspecific isozyme isoform X1 [Dendroctonus ponderosae]|uniref:alkaline phosphatase, tissue-nonspecific isozyme isoform X1 n=1 Tax=Dendroctonus ponderosae TaxID=77166 RepID=UPI00203525AD|nr:alkaline phosphatase, tissue-nonspecific isozyme isoform X1 [Dendroctonus ponderosae]